MGVAYKLNSKVKDFILQKKKEQPLLSCRQLVILLEEKFLIKISKSSINAVIKEAGLSQPVGRRRKKRRKIQIIPSAQEQEIKLLAYQETTSSIQSSAETELAKGKNILEEKLEDKEGENKAILETVFTAKKKIPHLEPGGVFFLKAADFLLGGSMLMKEALSPELRQLSDGEILELVEALVFHPFYENLDISPYLNELGKIKELKFEFSKIFFSVSKEIRSIKVVLSDASLLYLDGKFYTVWSTPYVPYTFASTFYYIKNYLQKSFFLEKNLLIFNAPGYETPSKEFFDFMLGLEGKEKHISRLVLYSNTITEEEHIIPAERKYNFIFGLWPWQFGQFRKAIIKGEYKSYYFPPFKKDFYRCNNFYTAYNT